LESTTKIILSAILAFTSPTFATVLPIHKGDVAPYDAFLFDHDSESQAEQDRADAAYYKAVSDKQTEKIALEEKENQILNERLMLYINESNTLAKEDSNRAFNEKLLLFGSFSLGVIVTALITRNARP